MSSNYYSIICEEILIQSVSIWKSGRMWRILLLKSVTVKSISITKYSIWYEDNDSSWGRNTAHFWTLGVKFYINMTVFKLAPCASQHKSRKQTKEAICMKSIYTYKYCCTRLASLHRKLFNKGVLRIFINVTCVFPDKKSKSLSLVKLIINLQASVMSIKVTPSQEERTWQTATFRKCRSTGSKRFIFLGD